MAKVLSDDRIVDALKASRGLVHIAARSLGCSPQTIYTRRDKSERVRAAVENERNHTTDVAEAALFRAITNGEAWAVCFYLKTQGKSRGHVERVEQELSGEMVQRVVIVDSDAGAPPRMAAPGRGKLALPSPAA